MGRLIALRGGGKSHTELRWVSRVQALLRRRGCAGGGWVSSWGCVEILRVRWGSGWGRVELPAGYPRAIHPRVLLGGRQGGNSDTFGFGGAMQRWMREVRAGVLRLSFIALG